MADALVRIQLGPILSDCFGYFLSFRETLRLFPAFFAVQKEDQREGRQDIGASRKLAMI